MRAVLLLYIINFRVKVTSGLVKKALILTADQNNINEKYAVVTKTIPIEEGPYCCVCYDSHTGLNISKCEE